MFLTNMKTNRLFKGIKTYYKEALLQQGNHLPDTNFHFFKSFSVKLFHRNNKITYTKIKAGYILVAYPLSFTSFLTPCLAVSPLIVCFACGFICLIVTGNIRLAAAWFWLSAVYIVIDRDDSIKRVSKCNYIITISFV